MSQSPEQIDEAKARIREIAESAHLIVCGLISPYDVMRLSDDKHFPYEQAVAFIKEEREDIQERFQLDIEFSIEDMIFDEDVLSFPARDDLAIPREDWDDWSDTDDE